MRAWVVQTPGPVTSQAGPAPAPVSGQPGPVSEQPLRLVDRPVPVPGPGELLVRVRACGVCRTDLHLAEGDLTPHRPDTTPGHEVVGEVVAHGPGAGTVPLGAQVGIAWLRSTCGTCRYCLRGAENLCPYSTYTGWDADGGYAEYATVPEAYAYRLPDMVDPVSVAPLLCAGIIGYRALRRSGIQPGGRLGIWGFGASAHLTAQVAMAQDVEVHVFTRASGAQELARRLGAASVQGVSDPTPTPLDAAILFAPVGTLVPVALQALDRGGVLAIAGIHLTDVPALNYERHLFYEREIRSVTANTRQDGAGFLALAAQVRPEITTVRYPLDAADQALADLAADRITGVAVLDVTG